MNTELVILSHLIFTENFSRKVLPYVKPEYFQSKANQVTFDILSDFLNKYNAFPTKEALLIELSNKQGISEQVFNETKNLIIDIKPEVESNHQWLVDKAEEFCKERALHNAILASIKILDNKDSAMQKGGIPKIMSDALAVSFDTSIGHDFIEDATSRFDFYHTKESRIPFHLDMFNRITKGGLPRKTLNLGMAVTGGGKTRFMCDCAANNLKDGFNVLYITMKMAEERIAERIDANLLDIPLNDLLEIPKEEFEGKIKSLKEKTKGKLIIKEYPTASAGANNFRFLLNELKIKRNFTPDIIYIDYINICMSSRLKMGVVNSYGYIKSIAEELRGLAVEFNLPIVTATQINREGFNNSDLDMTNVSESIGLPATVDFMFGIVVNEELDSLNQIMIKQMKNRYGDIAQYRRFCIGVDKSKMKHYDIENPTEDLIQEDRPVMDDTTFGKREFDMSKFDGFK